MGRYAFFNTEYEYKFAFGVQDSCDILLFGGEGCLPVGTVASVSECLKSLGVSADICEILKTRKIRQGSHTLFEIV